ncbi:Uncharacterised protein [Bifidobacterium dentium]|nr:Uncharacterised protein [Bifidobacterium dentium]
MFSAISRSKSISIHALREESDGADASADVAGQISIHALREESDMSCSPCR